MLISAVSAALALGFAGQAHCAAMCSPLAIGASCTAGKIRARPAAEYLAGRIVAYAASGALAGAAGRTLERNTFSGARSAFVVAIALWFISKGVRLLFARRGPGLVQLPKRGRSFFAFLRLPSRGIGLGLITGLLPCGLLYGALGLAASTTSPLHGALALLVFALITAPGLYAPLFLRGLIERRFPVLRSPKVQGVMWCALGLWLSLRPLLDVVSGHPGGCHG